MALWSFGLHSSLIRFAPLRARFARLSRSARLYIRHLSLFYHDVGAVEMEEAVFEAAHGLAVDVNFDAADLVAVLGGGLCAADPGELAPFLTAELALGAAHVVDVQDIAGMADGLGVVLRLQEVSEGLRKDQAVAEAMEDHGHGGNDEIRMRNVE